MPAALLPGRNVDHRYILCPQTVESFAYAPNTQVASGMRFPASAPVETGRVRASTLSVSAPLLSGGMMMERETAARPPNGLGDGDVEGPISESKRQLLKVLLGGMTAYSVPLLASFSMDGLRIGGAEALARTFSCNLGTLRPEPATAALDGAKLVVSFSTDCYDSFHNISLCYLEFEVTAQAEAEAVYACRTRGSKIPSAFEEEEVTGPVTASVTFQPGAPLTKLSLTLEPPESPCPPGLEAVPLAVRYSYITLTVVARSLDIEAAAQTGCLPGIAATYESVFSNLDLPVVPNNLSADNLGA